MNYVERANKGVKAVMWLFGSLIYISLWPSDGDVLSRSLFIVVGVALIALAFWWDRRRRTRKAASAEQLKTDLQKRADELKESQKLKDDQVAQQAVKMLTDNWDLVKKFLDITERKVSVLDDYGDEQWDALPEEIIKFLKKLAERESRYVNWEFVKRTKGQSWKNALSGITAEWHLPEEYKWMVTKLQELFQQRHEEIKSRGGETDFESLSGVEFEAHIARLLRSAGYDVQGTPVTGDQGADLIAKKDGRTIIIQAKRYQGTVGNKAVQEVISAVAFYGGNEGWVVTNSTFTSSAIDLAQKAKIKLIDGTALKMRSVF
jgi:hypothetical protein